MSLPCSCGSLGLLSSGPSSPACPADVVVDVTAPRWVPSAWQNAENGHHPLCLTASQANQITRWAASAAAGRARTCRAVGVSARRHACALACLLVDAPPCFDPLSTVCPLVHPLPTPPTHHPPATPQPPNPPLPPCRVALRAKYIHDLTVCSGASMNVFERCSGRDVNLDQHRSAPFANLFTDIDVRVWWW